MGLQVHLVDGTYELFRHHFSPANKDPQRGATRGVVASCLLLLEQGPAVAVRRRDRGWLSGLAVADAALAATFAQGAVETVAVLVRPIE